jgi:hypothetical protein
MKANKEFTQELVDFIGENEDAQVNERLCDAVLNALTDENGKGNSRKAFCALAKVTSVFMKMWGEATKHTATEMMESYTDVLDFYCFAADHPVEEEEKR